MLRTSAGRELRVDAEAIAEFEVTKEQADAFLKSQLRETLAKLGSGLREALLGRAPPAGPQTSPTPGLDLLADLAGTPRESLTGDYAAMGRALGRHFGALAAAAKDAIGGDPQRMAAARERMAGWTETLREHGIAVPDSEVHETSAEPVANPPEPEGAPVTGDEPKLSDRLRGLAEEFRRRADALAAARQSAGPSNGDDAGKP